MATQNLPPTAPNGQTQADALATPIAIQQNITALRRQLCDNDAAFVRLLDERRTLESLLLAEQERYSDSLGADRLREQGRDVVAEVMGMWGIE